MISVMALVSHMFGINYFSDYSQCLRISFVIYSATVCLLLMILEGKCAKCCASTTCHNSICSFWWSSDQFYTMPLRASEGKRTSTVSILKSCFSFYAYYTDLFQCRMQVQGTDSLIPISSRYAGPLDCAIKTVKEDGVRNTAPCFSDIICDNALSWWKIFQVRGIFRGGFTTLLREATGNAVFFSVYEYVRYQMHLQLNSASSGHKNLIDLGVGVLSGGLSGIAVCIFPVCHSCIMHLFTFLLR